MKQKIINFVKSKWLGLVAGFVIALLSLLQELSLGSPNSWVLALAVPAIFGAFAEVVRFLATGGKYKWQNILMWVAGSVVAIIVTYVIY